MLIVPLYSRLITNVALSQVSGEHAVRRSRHLFFPRRVALGPSANAGARFSGAEWRNHLCDRTHFHLHARAWTTLTLPPGRRHYARRHQQHAHTRRQTARHHGYAVEPAAGDIVGKQRMFAGNWVGIYLSTVSTVEHLICHPWDQVRVWTKMVKWPNSKIYLL